MAGGQKFSLHFSRFPAAALAETWNGTSWQARATPNPAATGTAHLADVWCTKPSACMAAGGFVHGNGGPALALAESWNGRAWRLLPAVSPGPLSFSGLNGIACARGFRCLAAGGTGAQLTLAERWTGARWLRLSTPDP